jgi:hypothetical protein
MQHLEGSGTPVLYIGRTVLKGSELGGHQRFLSQDQSIWGYLRQSISRKLSSPYVETKNPRCVIQPQTCFVPKKTHTQQTKQVKSRNVPDIILIEYYIGESSTSVSCAVNVTFKYSPMRSAILTVFVVCLSSVK